MSTYSDAVNALSPAGYWRLGDLSGTTVTSAVSGITGVYENAGGGALPTLAQAGLVSSDPDTSVDWNAAAQQAKFTRAGQTAIYDAAFWPASGRKISVVLWIRPRSWGAGKNRRIFECGAESSWELMRDSGDSSTSVLFRVHGGGTPIAAIPIVGTIDATITLNTPHMIVGTWDADGDGKSRIYLDGALAALGTAVSTSAMPGGDGITAITAAIGNKPDANFDGDNSDGQIDEVATFAFALNAFQIAGLYAAGAGNKLGPSPARMWP